MRWIEYLWSIATGLMPDTTGTGGSTKTPSSCPIALLLTHLRCVLNVSLGLVVTFSKLYFPPGKEREKSEMSNRHETKRRHLRALCVLVCDENRFKKAFTRETCFYRCKDGTGSFNVFNEFLRLSEKQKV